MRDIILGRKEGSVNMHHARRVEKANDQSM
jgi:hypothetical protein